MSDEMISVIEAGRELERRKATIFRVMKRLGIHAHKRRDSSSRNQVVAYLTHADASVVTSHAGSRCANRALPSAVSVC